MKKLYLFLLIFFTSPLCSANEIIFYALRTSADRISTAQELLSDLEKHYKKINILIPQSYVIYEKGNIEKGPDPEILDFATKHTIKIMPLVTNTKFDKEIAHRFLSNNTDQTQAINTLIEDCKKNHFIGVQLDFEMIMLNDRAALTHFYELAAKEFHKNNLLISFAVAPVVSDQHITYFQKKNYENWEGAYDFRALAKIADFISIMAYNQHAGHTTPGPTASLPWVDQSIKYALKYIPANKISLGIPTYSTYWFTGSEVKDKMEKLSVEMHSITYQEALALAAKNKQKFIWDKQFSVFYAVFYKNDLNEYLFLENAKSFAKKYDLVKKYNLRGISVFDLGSEDPKIWSII